MSSLDMLVRSFKIIVLGILPIPLIAVLINVSEILAAYQTSFTLGIFTGIIATAYSWFWIETVYKIYSKQNKKDDEINKRRQKK